MFGVVWDYYSSKLKGKQYKQNTSPKGYKNEIKILANPGLAYSGFEQPSPGLYKPQEVSFSLKTNPLEVKKKLISIFNPAEATVCTHFLFILVIASVTGEAIRGQLLESWLALTICLEVSKPICFDGS